MRASQARSADLARIASSACSASGRWPASSRSAARANPASKSGGGCGCDRRRPGRRLAASESESVTRRIRGGSKEGFVNS